MGLGTFREWSQFVANLAQALFVNRGQAQIVGVVFGRLQGFRRVLSPTAGATASRKLVNPSKGGSHL